MDNFTPYAVIPNKDKWAENAFKSAQNLLSRGYNDLPPEIVQQGENQNIQQISNQVAPSYAPVETNMGQVNQPDIQTYAVPMQEMPQEQVNTKSIKTLNDDLNKIALIESKGNHYDKLGNLTKSSKGALGKFQIMPETAAQPGYGVTPIPDLTKATIGEHEQFASQYFTAMLNKFDGDKEKALAAYNGGPGMLEKAIKKDPVNWKKHIPKESLNYIKQFQAL